MLLLGAVSSLILTLLPASDASLPQRAQAAQAPTAPPPASERVLPDAVAPDVPSEWRPSKTVQLGGQALVEGVMMRSPRYVAASVRRSDGSITTRLEPVSSVMQKHRFLAVPFVRGVVGLFEMLALGMRYLNWSSNMALEDEGAKSGTSRPQPDALPWWMFLLTIATSLGFGMLLFVAAPHWIAGATVGHWTRNSILFNAIEGAIKLVIFVTYVWMIGLRPNIQRVFEYHGAEHKVVYAVENNRPLTAAGARPFDTPHPRCGTGFALLTILVSVICFAFLPLQESRIVGALWRIGLMPVVAGVSYEIIKLTTHPRWRPLAVLVLTPGLWLQRLTTRQPDDAQLEVACEAMRAVLKAEGGHPVAKPGMV